MKNKKIETVNIFQLLTVGVLVFYFVIAIPPLIGNPVELAIITPLLYAVVIVPIILAFCFRVKLKAKQDSLMKTNKALSIVLCLIIKSTKFSYAFCLIAFTYLAAGFSMCGVRFTAEYDRFLLLVAIPLLCIIPLLFFGEIIAFLTGMQNENGIARL